MQTGRHVAGALLTAAARAGGDGGALGAWRFGGTLGVSALPIALVRGLSHDADERKRWEWLKSQGHKVNP